MSDNPPTLEETIDKVVAHYDADLLIYIGLLHEPDDDEILRQCRRLRGRRRRNLVMVLSTPGGSADAAYRIARTVHRAYDIKHDDPTKRGLFFLYVHDFCKSAGTLLALGASQIIMAQRAQLGPIDVQLLKEEEVGERRSGLAPRQALETLSMETGRSFSRLFRYMRFDSRTGLSTKMAAELAATMAVGVMEPVYAQLDPIRLGEVERFVRISQEYGERLRTQNVKRGTADRLLSGYPSHEFVIDREEAGELFERVDVPIDELEMVAEVFINAHHPSPESPNSFINFVSLPTDPQAEASQAPTETDANVQASDDAAGESQSGAGPARRQTRSDAERTSRSARAQSNGG